MLSSLAENLNSIVSVDDPLQLKKLDEIIISAIPDECTEADFQALFALFERFPDSDGFGVFWSIVHLIEACKGYEPYLLESVHRRPVEFNVLMINRQLNANINEISGQPLAELLKSITTNVTATNEARAIAQEFLNYQNLAKTN